MEDLAETPSSQSHLNIERKPKGGGNGPNSSSCLVP